MGLTFLGHHVESESVQRRMYCFVLFCQVFESKLGCKRVELKMREMLKSGGRLSSCVILANRVSRKTRRVL